MPGTPRATPPVMPLLRGGRAPPTRPVRHSAGRCSPPVWRQPCCRPEPWAASVSGGTASADTLTFAVDGVTSSTSTEQMKTEQADAVRVAADRSATNAQRSVAAARSAQREKVKAAALAKARKAAAERAAAAAQRKRVIANAQRDPKAAAAHADARLRLQLTPVGLPRAALDRRERLALHGRERLLRRLRHPAVPARPQDGDRRARLPHQPGDPDQVGPGLHQALVRHPVQRPGQWHARSPHWY